MCVCWFDLYIDEPSDAGVLLRFDLYKDEPGDAGALLRFDR